MEDYQVSTIIHNLPFLLDNTECSTQLLSWLTDFLNYSDIQSIKSEKSNYDKNYRLYEVMRIQVGGYDKLVEALMETKQTKAAAVLFSSLLFVAISNCTVEIPAKMGKITDFLTKDQLQACVAALLKTTSTLDLYEDYKNLILNNTKIQLKDTVPPHPKYYIPRNLYARRAVLDRKVFLEKCQDVFVFKCTHPVQLVLMLKNQPVSSSEKQLVKVTARFILLKEEADWKVIFRKSKFPTHLVRHEFADGKHSLVLEDTTAGSSVIHKYLEHQPNNVNATIPEQEFIQTALQTRGSGICICDKPGMGKSFLLTNLARSTQISSPERLVIFSQLSQISEKISVVPEEVDEHLFEDIFLGPLHENAIARIILAQFIKFGDTPMELFFDGFDEIQQEHVKTTKKFLAKLGGIRNIRLFVTSRINTRTDLEETLGVMAYDIQPFTNSNQQEFLTTYWRTKHPENDNSRIKEYASLCLKKISKNLSERDRDIAGVPLICRLVAEVNSDNANIYSEPGRTGEVKIEWLDKFTLSQMYAKYIELQLGAKPCNFDFLFKGHDSGTGSFNARKRSRHDEQCKIRSYHAWIAIQILFPSLGAKLEKFIVKINPVPSLLSAGLLEKRFGSLAKDSEFDARERPRNDEKCKIRSHHPSTAIEGLPPDLRLVNLVAINTDPFLMSGLLEKRVGSSALSADLQFTHRTFAEYLATEFISQFWLQSSSNSYQNEVRNIMADFTFFEMLRASEYTCYEGMFENGVCVYFYEDLLQSRPEAFINGASELSSSTPSLSYYAAIHGIILNSIKFNYEKIFSLVLNLIAELVLSNPGQESSYFCLQMKLVASKHSEAAVRRGNVRIVEQLLSFLHNTRKFDCKNSKFSRGNTSLELAVESEDIELVQCVSKFWLFYDADLLWTCLKRDDIAYYYLDDLRLSLCGIVVSQSMSNEIEADSLSHLDVIKGILNLDMGKSLYEEAHCAMNNESKTDSIFSIDMISFDLFNHFVSVFFPGEMRYFVLDKLSVCEYLELENFVWETKKVDISFKTNHQMPLRAVELYIKSKEFQSKLEEILSLYDKPVPVHLLLTNAFHNSVGWLDVKSLKFLVECGAMYWDNSGIEKDRTALHLAVWNFRHIENVEYLISLGLSTNSQDEDGNTPLHLATKRRMVEVMKVLIKSGCDMHLRNGRGSTFIQEAATATGESYSIFPGKEIFFELAVFLKEFVGKVHFREKNGIFMEGLVARYGTEFPEKVKQLLL